MFEDVAASVNRATANVLYATVPSGTEGPVQVSVETGAEAATAPGSFLPLAGGSRAFEQVGTGITETFGNGVDLAWGDFDSDGDLDLATAGGNQPARIFRNTGGSFEKVEANLPRSFGGGVDWGDFDGDGDLDLALSGLGGPDTKIYENKGNGSFSPLGAGLVGLSGADVKWGDYDSDGDLDLVVAGETDGRKAKTQLYRNDGDGTFTPVETGLIGVEDASLGWGDFNGDGALDLSVGGARDAAIYEGDGDGEFTALGADLLSGPVAWGDYNEDGSLDLATGEGIYRNEGGSFSPIGADLGTIGTLNWGDFDADGDLDLIVSRKAAEGPETRLFENQSGAFVERDLGFVGVNGGAHGWGDYNSDGTLDVAIAGNPQSTGSGAVMKMYENSVSSSPGFAVTSITPESGTPGTEVEIQGTGFAATSSENEVTFGNSEGLVQSASPTTLTVVVPEKAGGRVEVSVQSGGKTATSSRDFSVLRRGKNVFKPLRADIQGSGDGNVAWGDFDDDGDADLAVVGNKGGGAGERAAAIYQNDGDGSFSKIGAGLTGVFRADAAWGDYDGDGDLDLVIAGFTGIGPVTELYRNDGNGTFTAIDADLEGVGEAALGWGDYDEDGDLDLAVVGERGAGESPTARIYKNEGQGTFAPIGAGLVGVSQASLSWVDYDTDGDLDLSVVGRDAAEAIVTKVYENDGEGNFSAGSIGIVGRPESSLAWGDYQQDGDPDLAVPGAIYVNEGDGTFTAEPGPDFRDSSLEWGDFNANGFLGLAVAGESGSRFPTARVFRRSGSAVETGLTGVQRASVDWTDFDSDGDLDLVIGGRDVDESAGGGGVKNITTIYENTATPGRRSLSISSVRPRSGTPGTNVRIRGTGFALSPSANSVTFGDIEAPVDSASRNALYVKVPSGLAGSVEVSVQARGASVQASEPFSVLKGGGSSFEQVEAGLAGVSEASLDWGDFDSDGDLDLLVAGRSGSANGTVIYRNQANGSFVSVGAGLPGVAEGPSAKWGDYDGDGDLDAALSGNRSGGPVTYIYRNDENGTFKLVKSGLGVRFGELAWGDYDSDGDLDLVVTGMLATLVPKTKVYRNDGNDQFVATGGGVPEAGRSSVAWADVVGDSGLDLAVAGSGVNGNVGTVARNQKGTFVRSDQEIGGQGLGWSDFDSDGDLDLAGGSEIYRNEGGGTLVPMGADLPFIGQDGDLSWGDFDGDGDSDLLISGGSQPKTRIYRNDDGTFSPLGAGLVGLDESSVAWGDIDGDGDLDLAIAGKQDRAGGFAPTLRIYTQEGDPIPVEIAEIRATEVRDAVRLQWVTASESGNARFEIERSVEGGPWTVVDATESKAPGGTSDASLSYRFTDRNVPFRADTLRYRLRQVDLDGSSSLSRTVALGRGTGETRLLPPAPNPARSRLKVCYEVAVEVEDSTLRIYNALGQVVRSVSTDGSVGRHQKTLDVTGLPSGHYFLRLGGESVAAQSFTVVR